MECCKRMLGRGHFTVNYWKYVLLKCNRLGGLGQGGSLTWLNGDGGAVNLPHHEPTSDQSPTNNSKVVLLGTRRLSDGKGCGVAR